MVESLDDAAGVSERDDVESVGMEEESVGPVDLGQHCSFCRERLFCQLIVDAVVAADGDVVGGVGEDHVVPRRPETSPSLVEERAPRERGFVPHGVEAVVLRFSEISPAAAASSLKASEVPLGVSVPDTDPVKLFRRMDPAVHNVSDVPPEKAGQTDFRYTESYR